ncbi:MAG: cobyric acid synthase [Pseudomonadota bacterium]
MRQPNSDKGAQVIIQGHSIGNMDAVDYHKYKSTAMSFALESYERLAASYDLVIVEGAGSPAEINLRENDVANMGFATAAHCPVLLVADIDRGGVFAHLKGTLDCLSEEERSLVKGTVINRFRGDKALLDSGIDWLEQNTGIPTIGVLPYLQGLHIEAEDAVANESRNGATDQNLKVVVPRIPRISNHTDFDVLRMHPRVDLRFISAGEQIPAADLIILPGSKSTIQDLNWLFENGWQPVLQKHLRYGGKMIGICGGYQMIGKQVHDPDGLEGPPDSLDGFGLLDFETTLVPRKTLLNVTGTLTIDGSRVTGYEIHMGQSSGPDLDTAAIDLDGRKDGVISSDNQILCSYLHGLFDHQEACSSLLNWAGLDNADSFDYDQFRQNEIDRVADMLEGHLDNALMQQILFPEEPRIDAASA